MTTGKAVHLKRETFDVRIDRDTPWGNPFVLNRDGNRKEVIEKFERWARTSNDQTAVWIREHVHELKDKVLGCWCGPKACHGDVLLQMADEADALRAAET